MGTRLTQEEVEHIARLARLELSPEEVERMRQDLTRILDYVATLQRLDTEAVPPTAHIQEVTNVFREDQTCPSLPREEALSGAPDRTEAFFRVPRVIE